MTELSERYPDYGFAQHKGYSTRSHMRALAEHGPCPEHRASFANVMGLAQRGADTDTPDGWVDDIPEDDDLAGLVPEQMRSGELLDEELSYG